MRTHDHFLLLSALCAAACGERAPVPSADSAPRADSPPSASCGAPGLRQVVEQLGGRMQRVSLPAPDSIVARELRDAYAPLVTPELLQAWLADPASAPGRKVSSPWPERIEIRSVDEADGGTCRVEGEVIYATSTDAAHRGAALREPVRLSARLTGGGAWRISAYEVVATPSTGSDASGPADVIRRYYAAVGSPIARRSATTARSFAFASTSTVSATPSSSQ